MAKNNDSSKKEKNEGDLVEKVLYVNRCSLVVKGGRKFSFSALILVGDGNGLFGYGFAKANELTDAIRKAGEAAKKDMRRCSLEGSTIPHELIVQWDGAKILFKPAPKGTGVIAAPNLRPILEFAGVTDVVVKNLGSSNPINQVKATFRALDQFLSRDEIARRRG